MKNHFAFLALALACIPHMAETEAAPVATEASARKSIVPAKYAGKYKNGGSDPLAEFVKAQCTGKDGFEFTAFFELCRRNGINEEQVKKYDELVAAKAHGANGRARMTLRNMLATVARKNGSLIGLNGETVALDLPKPAISGAAAKAVENSEASEPASESL